MRRQSAKPGLEVRPEWILDFPHPLFSEPEEILPYELRFASAARAMADLHSPPTLVARASTAAPYPAA